MNRHIDIIDVLKLLRDRADPDIRKILAAAIDEITRLRQEVTTEQHAHTQRTDR